MHQDFGDVQYPVLAVIVPDREAPDVDRMSRVIGTGQCRGAVVQRHRHGKDLEERTELIDAESVPVEHPVRERNGGMVGIRSARVVRIKIGQRHHRQDFAGVDIHDQPGSAFRGEVVDDPLQFLAEDVLGAEVERQLQRLPAILQRVVEPALDPGEARIVDAGVADDMRRQRPIRIDSTLFVLELQPRYPELIDLVLFARRQVALDVYEALARGQLGVDIGAFEARESLHQLTGGVGRVDDLFGVGVDRGAVERGCEQLAVAVDDVGAGWPRWYRYPEARHVRLGGAAAFQHHHFDDPQRDCCKNTGEQDTGDEKPGATSFQGLPRRTLGDDRGTRRRLEMPRSAWIVVEGLGCDHHRFAMICEIKSSSDFARRGALGFTTAFTATVFASCRVPTGFSSNAGITRSALCAVCGSATALTSIGAGFRDGTPSDGLATALDDGVDSTAARTVVASAVAAAGGGAGGTGRSGMSAGGAWRCLGEVRASDRDL